MTQARTHRMEKNERDAASSWFNKIDRKLSLLLELEGLIYISSTYYLSCI